MEEIKKTAEEIRLEAEKNVKSWAKETVVEETEKMAKGLTELTEKSATKEELEKANKSLKSEIDKLSSDIKKASQMRTEDVKEMNIAEVISKSLVESKDQLAGFTDKEMKITLKEIDNASFVGNALANATSELRGNLYSSPFSPLYLRNIFPNVKTDASSIIIPQVQQITGGVDVWARGTGDDGVDEEKPEVDITYKDVTVPVKWIAGFTTVNRELLLNVKYLQSSITNTLLYSRNGLFASENKMITDYLAANAIAYSGNKTIAVEMLIDAAFNQLLGNYMTPTHILINQADYLTYVKFNKAAGSGEYDNPNDVLRGFSGTGLETNVQIVPVPSLAAGTAYVVSANEFEFINRLAPEMEVSKEHDKNFTFNKVTFRVEEMAGFVAKDLNAMVKVTF